MNEKKILKRLYNMFMKNSMSLDSLHYIVCEEQCGVCENCKLFHALVKDTKNCLTNTE